MSSRKYQVDFGPCLIVDADDEMREDEVIDLATEELMSWSKEEIIAWLHEYSMTVEEYEDEDEDDNEEE